MKNIMILFLVTFFYTLVIVSSESTLSFSSQVMQSFSTEVVQSSSSQDLQGFSLPSTPRNSESDLIVGVASAHDVYSEPELIYDDPSQSISNIEFDPKNGSALDKFLEMTKDKSLSVDIRSSGRLIQLVQCHPTHVKLCYPHRCEITYQEAYRLHQGLMRSSKLVARVYQQLAEAAEATEYGTLVKKHEGIVFSVQGFGTLKRTLSNNQNPT